MELQEKTGREFPSHPVVGGLQHIWSCTRGCAMANNFNTICVEILCLAESEGTGKACP